MTYKFKQNLMILVLIVLFSLVYVSAQSSFSSGSSASFSNVQYFQPGFAGGVSGYSSGYNPVDIEEFNNVCRNRQDFIIQINPGDCSPAVVRSDLLAEQNVPVFCKLTAIQVNPLIDSSNIRNIRLVPNGGLPENVVGVSYYRPNRNIFASSDSDFLSFNDIGYAVIILKREPNENLQPEFVHGNLTVRLDYSINGGLGEQINEIIVPVLSEQEWPNRYQEFSILDDRGYLRVESFSGESARVSVYTDADRKVDSFTIEKGKKSGERYLAGSYCDAGYSVTLVEKEAAEDKATILVNGDEYQVYRGDKLGNGCVVNKIEAGEFGTGEVSLKCPGSNSFKLSIENNPVTLSFDGVEKDYSEGDLVYSNNGNVYLGGVSALKTSEGNKFFVVLTKSSSFDDALKSKLSSFIENVKTSSDINNAKSKSNEEFNIIFEGEEGSFNGKDISFVSFSGVENVVSGNPDFDSYFSLAVKGYGLVLEDYKDVEYPIGTNLPNDGYKTYGQASVEQVLELAKDKGMSETQIAYSQVANENDYGVSDDELVYLGGLDYTNSRYQYSLDGINWFFSLEKIEGVESTKTSVQVIVAGQSKTLREVGAFLSTPDSGGAIIKLISFSDDSIVVEGNCNNAQKTIALGKSDYVCNVPILVSEINIDEHARIKVEPVIKYSDGVANLSYHIGVEQRAVQLSPDKALERIAKLNATIQKWERVNENLGKIVEAGKAACFTTSAVLQVKNFLGGLGGKAIARENVMKGSGGWNEYCNKQVSEGRYSSMEVCFNDNSAQINSDVNAVTEIIKIQNDENKKVNDDAMIEDGGLFGGDAIDSGKANNEYFQTIKEKYKNTNLEVGEEGKEINVGEVINNLNEGDLTRDELRDLDLYMRINQINSESPVLSDLAEKELYNNLRGVSEITRRNVAVDTLQDYANTNGLVGNAKISFSRPSSNAPVDRIYENAVVDQNNNFNIGNSNLPTGTPIQIVEYSDPLGIYSGRYFLALSPTDQSNTEYAVARGDLDSGVEGRLLIFDSNKNIVSEEIANKINADFNLFKRYDSTSYQNTFQDAKVRYYETDPYKGMPAIVPFDLKNGWYAATRQVLGGALGSSLSGGSGIESYADSGQVTSFWICNVDGNNVEEFVSGFGDDVCQQINLNTGQPLDQFPGLSESEARTLTSNAIRAIQDAKNQYKPGVKEVSVLGTRIAVGDPASAIPSGSCQDFMSPSDCQLMFNVCDPVICPSSRCDLGGKYKVDDVIQTGIVGSVFMCLPNVKEGIAVPICLTGVHAGVDNFVSILKANRDCLQESVETGQYVGICDEITAIYKCEFFWRQLSPGINVILPKLIETVSGNRVRGGGEYASVTSAWQNMQGSIDYFTDQYAVNSLKAFRIRSTQEVGTPICKSFVSTRFPNKFKSLIEPDSPHQFSAWFDEIPLTTATTPSTSQYKVFYHIYAGNDQGIYYSVYLKNPTGASFIQSTGIVVVDTGFVGKGEYISETRDMSAPAGFKELCVRINGQDKCGFKQVSTSFAINYLRDEYVSNQIEEVDIKTEKECISGSPDPLAVINPNIQSGAEDALTPAIYERGIIRICGSENPGSGTDSDRWVKVGICGDQKIACWLDTQSVDRAIGNENIGIKNSTTEYLEDLAEFIKNQEGGGNIIDNAAERNAIFSDVEKDILSIKGSGLDEGEGISRVIFAKLDGIESGNILSQDDYARFFFDKALVYELLAREVELKPVEQQTPDSDSSEVPVGSVDGGEEGEDGGDGDSQTIDVKSKNQLFLEDKGITVTNSDNIGDLSIESVWVLTSIKLSSGKDLRLSAISDNEFEIRGGAASDFYSYWNSVSSSSSSRTSVAGILPLVSAISSREFDEMYFFKRDAVSVFKEFNLLPLGNRYVVTITDVNSISDSINSFGVNDFEDIPDAGDISVASFFIANMDFDSGGDYDNSLVGGVNSAADLKIDISFNYVENQITNSVSKGEDTIVVYEGNSITYAEMVEIISKEKDVNSNLIKAQIAQESSWNQNVKTSSSIGLMQVSPIVFKDFSEGKCKNQIPVCSDLSQFDKYQTDPIENVNLGICYFKCIEEVYGINDPRLAVAGYNAGPGRVKDACNNVYDSKCEDYLHKLLNFDNQPWTSAKCHVDRVMRNYLRYSKIAVFPLDNSCVNPNS